MALIPIFEIGNIVTYKSVDKEKIKVIMICAHAQCKQKQTNKDITEQNMLATSPNQVSQ